jgi:hypothetical protein
MSDISSINFEKSIPINTQHNERIIPPSYLIGKDYEVNRSSAEALALKQSMINRAIENYNKHKKPKAPPFKAKSYEWSAVVNLKPSSTMQDLENLAQHLQDKYGFQCYQIAIHKDEGHKDEDGNEVLNLHAHLEFITLDKDTGINKFNRRDIKYQTLRDIQTETAQILGMRRGVDKRLSGAKRVKPRVWAKMKESEKGERKKLLENVKSKHEHELGEVKFKANQDILKYKESKDDEIIGLQTALNNEKKAHELTKKELNTLKIEFNKENMKGKGFVKADFDNLGNCVKEMAEKMKLGEKFTTEQVTQKFNEILLQAQENKELREKAEQERDEKAQELERDRETITELRNILADLRDKEPAKTAENQITPQEYEFLENKALSTIEITLNGLQKNEHPETQLNRVNSLKDKMQELETKAPNTFKTALQRYFENSKSTFENFVNDCIAHFKEGAKQIKLTKTQNTGLQR